MKTSQAGIGLIATITYRDHEAQDALYAQRTGSTRHAGVHPDLVRVVKP